jgi:AGZA family xanthine/uracil permease-like MFS transporter
MTNTDAGVLERWFHLSEQGTTPRTEILAGVTTFLTLAYILFVQPALMSSIGLDFGAVFVATCLASAFATLLMAGLANYPIAVAPAMGHNFYFVFTVVVAMDVPWRWALSPSLACSSLPRPGSGSGSGLSWPFHVP